MLFNGTLVLELQNNFDSFEEEEKVKAGKFALLILFMISAISAVSAEIKHITMRVEGMT
jgi:hypothetical protein